MIHLLREKVVSTQIQDMLERYENMIKIVVDIRHENLRRQLEAVTYNILGGVR